MNDSESLSEAFKDFDYNRQENTFGFSKELFSSSYIDIIKELIVKVETLERAIVELNESIKTGNSNK